MANGVHWLPGGREEQLNMARVWIIIIPGRNIGNVPAADITELTTLTGLAETILQAALSNKRTTIITAECQRIFGELVQKMRFIKDRYFKNPPLADEDYVALLLKVPDHTRTPRGISRAQITAEIGRSGTSMLILLYRYAEWTENLADSHTDIRYQVRYGVLPPSSTPATGIELTTSPTTPEELPIVFASKRRKDIITFNPGDSGKMAYFCIHLENRVGGYGPWCPLFSAIIL
ncbi:MAG: hypothetical protein LBQ77_01550 [Treponema sp.]|jgi:hypothetical protein|nr:hypothetical protein [Treponema sp.]